jgi:hypothetical protein
MMDFAPAFAIALWVSLQLFFQLFAVRYPTKPSIVIALLLTVSAWWVYQVVTTKIFPDTAGGTVAEIRRGKVSGSPVVIGRDAYTRATETNFDIPFNLYGWERSNGRTASLVVLFLSGAGRLELELTPVNKTQITQKDWDHVRVKVGLEEFEFEGMSESPQGRILTFKRASPPVDSSRIEVAFITLTSAQESGRGSKFRLERVSWSKAKDQ